MTGPALGETVVAPDWRKHEAVFIAAIQGKHDRPEWFGKKTLKLCMEHIPPGTEGVVEQIVWRGDVEGSCLHEGRHITWATHGHWPAANMVFGLLPGVPDRTIPRPSTKLALYLLPDDRFKEYVGYDERYWLARTLHRRGIGGTADASFTIAEMLVADLREAKHIIIHQDEFRR